MTENKKLNSEELEKVNGGVRKRAVAEVPYESYIGSYVFYNTQTWRVADAYAEGDRNVCIYYYKLQSLSGNTITVDKSTFETIISGGARI